MSEIRVKLLIFYAYLRCKYLRRFRTRQALERWQEKQMRFFLHKILPLSTFYREQSAGLSHDEWRKFPLIDKNIMMANFNQLNTRGIDHDQAMELALHSEQSRDFTPTLSTITVGLSSGTSGNRGLFLVSPKERALHAGTILAKILPHSIFKKSRIAFFLRSNSNLYTTAKSSRLAFEFFELLDDVNRHINRLNDYQPTLLIAPPSMLRILARKVESGVLKIAPIKIISVAEVLDPLDRREIERAFQSVIHQVYQCTEGFLGVSCEHGTLHLNEDLVVIEKEYIDRDLGKFIPIVTDFSRTTQPIIRYRLNDILTERREPCPCGSHFQALEFIEGRSDDLIYFKKLRTQKPKTIFPDFIRRSILLASEHIEEYTVIQPAMGILRVALKTLLPSQMSEAETAVMEQLNKLAAELDCYSPCIDFDHSFETQGLKKLRRVVRAFQPPERLASE